MTAVRKLSLSAFLVGALLGAMPTSALAQIEAGSQADLQWLDLGPPQWDLTGYTVWDDEARAARGFGKPPVVPATSGGAQTAAVAASSQTDPAPMLERVSFQTSRPAWTGAAAWHGPEFDGRLTVTGERFDMYRLTAASRDLPLNSYVTVANLRTGEVVTVRINDRPPAGAPELITLSLAAATRLGLDRQPEAAVKVEYLGPAAPGAGDPVQLASR